MVGFSSSQLGPWDANNGGPGFDSGVGISVSGEALSVELRCWIGRGGPNFQVKEGAHGWLWWWWGGGGG